MLASNGFELISASDCISGSLNQSGLYAMRMSIEHGKWHTTFHMQMLKSFAMFSPPLFHILSIACVQMLSAARNVLNSLLIRKHKLNYLVLKKKKLTDSHLRIDRLTPKNRLLQFCWTMHMHSGMHRTYANAKRKEENEVKAKENEKKWSCDRRITLSNA